MSASVPPSDAQSASTCRIFEDRSQYLPCHVRLPDQERRVAAIQVEGQYYSFFKTLKDRHQSLEIAARLVKRGDVPVITKTVKGDAIWVLELEAIPGNRPKAQVTYPISSVESSPYQILESKSMYRLCRIRVPDLDKPLAAVQTNGKYYGLLKILPNQLTAIEIAKRLGHKGNETVITKVTQGYALWVFEPDVLLE